MCVCEEGKVTISLGLAIFPRFHHPSDMVEKGRGIISGWMGNCCMDESTRDWEPRREREVMAGEGEGIMVERAGEVGLNLRVLGSFEGSALASLAGGGERSSRGKCCIK